MSLDSFQRGGPPPKDVPASDLFQRLLEAPRPTEVIDFPRCDANGDPIGQLRLQVVRAQDIDTARSTAFGKLKKRGFNPDDMDSPGMREVLGDAVAKELLALACLTAEGYGEPAVYARIFPDADSIGKALAPDELAYLFSAYILVQHKYGPMERMAPEFVDAWIKRLVEGGSGFPLLSLSLPDLVELTTSLAAKIYGVCGILASQLSNLPPTLASSLETLIPDIASFGSPAASPERASSANKHEVSFENAVALSERLRG